MTTDEKNAETSRKEVASFKSSPPRKYFSYLRALTVPEAARNGYDATLITWTGDILGYVKCGKKWFDNFRGERQSITVRGINGCDYYGTAFISSGDYCRITMTKKSWDGVQKWAKAS